jgi:hypothetical protein
VSDDLSNNYWGQVGYYISGSSVPFAFYQIWNLNNMSILTSGITSVSTGTHTFSMYLQSGTTWVYALDGVVLGTYNMGANSSSSSYPVYAVSEEQGSGVFSFPAVTFSTAMQVLRSGAWSSVQTAESYGTAWGVAGASQDEALQADQVIVGGSLATLSVGITLWSSAASTTSSTATTSSSVTLPPATTTLASTSVTTAGTSTSTQPLTTTNTATTDPLTTLSCSLSSVVVGSQARCKVTVAGSSPTGKVAFSGNGSGKFSAPACSLKKGSCSVKYRPTSAGSTVTLTASYLGDKRNSASSGTFSLAVSKETSRVVLSCSPVSAKVGKTTRCNAHVEGYSTTGTVTWDQSSTDGGSVAFSPTSCTTTTTGLHCTIAMTGTTVGAVTIQATYSGDSNNEASFRTHSLTIK